MMLATAAMLAGRPAHAGLFDDDEARRAILDIRSRIDAVNQRVDTKADKNSALSLSDQNDQVRQEMARLRGQIEVLQNSVDQLEQRQKDFYADLDTRMRKLEPQQMQVDGRQVAVAQAEQRAYDAALTQFKGNDYKGALSSFNTFMAQYPQSGYLPLALYFAGSAQFALKENKAAITTLQQIPDRYPDSEKAPDALLLLSGLYNLQRDNVGSRKAMELLMSRYPDSQAAASARQQATGKR